MINQFQKMFLSLKGLTSQSVSFLSAQSLAVSVELVFFLEFIQNVQTGTDREPG